MKLYYKKITMWKAPEDVFQQVLSTQNDVFWLDSSKVEKGLARFSYMGKAATVYTYTRGKKQPDIFLYLKKQLQKLYLSSSLPFNFIGGYIGYFAYELQKVYTVEKTTITDYPESMWFYVDKFFVFDQQEEEIYLVCLANNKEKAETWFAGQEEKIHAVHVLVSDLPHDTGRKVDALTFLLARNKKQYLKDIATCKEYLQNGESYQICLTNTLTTSVNVHAVDLYYSLRALNPAPFAAFLMHNDFAILSSSPERFLSIDTNRTIEAKPIKGTSRRSKNKALDQKLASMLLHNRKDRAENMMITDLLRNDLGKVCVIGSVSVPTLIALESYETVHQLVSTIRGKLRDTITPVDAVLACFPGGSMTGAPKKRTMEIISSLEKKNRGVYAGTLGYMSFNGTIDLSIVIRTVVKHGNMLSIGTGGGILMQSDAEKEYKEMLLKAHILLQAISKTAGANEYIITA